MEQTKKNKFDRWLVVSGVQHNITLTADKLSFDQGYTAHMQVVLVSICVNASPPSLTYIEPTMHNGMLP
jgi:hypothetical protein